MSSMLFEVLTPLGFSVRCTVPYWEFISTVKHPVMAGKDKLIAEVLSDPEEVRQSRKDPLVFLFYRSFGTDRFICAVTKKEDGSGFLITAYLTDAIKAGELIWTK